MKKGIRGEWSTLEDHPQDTTLSTHLYMFVEDRALYLFKFIHEQIP